MAVYYNTKQYSTPATHEQPKSKSKSRKVRRQNQKLIRNNNLRQQNERYIKNMSNEKLSNEEISLLSKGGLKFVPTPNLNAKTLRRQLIQDFNEFERRMRLQFIFANDKKEPHPFHVKSNWKPPVTQSDRSPRKLFRRSQT